MQTPSQYFKAHLLSNHHGIEFGFFIVHLDCALDDVQCELEELHRVDILLKVILVVVFKHLFVELVWLGTLGRISVCYHLVVFIFLTIVFDVHTVGFFLVNFVFGYHNLEVLLLSPLIEEHVSGCSIAVPARTEEACGVLISIALFGQVLEVPIRD